ncbi:MAG: hypothetical protein DI564_05875 [Rhodanobacter denitrificans]|uniref:GLUG domain-containing protein n=1 Tax=Rhodanobacter denitrificans TaxID=666685 RepID=A0A2W5KPD9_9GAMM|nr:MAG: hypothetical protein DI564_05875 [Rhodanobacter denitrificans]
MRSIALLHAVAALAALVSRPALADYVIAPSGGDITGARLSALLAGGDVTLTAASGDVVVNDTVSWSAHTLTLSAPSGNVNVNAVMTAAGSAGLSLETDASEADGGVAMALTGGGFTGRVDFTGTGQSYRVNGTPYTLIHTMAELEAIRPASGTINGAYALAADVDWSDVISTTPLGILGGSDRFDGLGHRLLDLVIPGNTDDTGLFSSADGGAVIRNLGVRGGSVSGGGWVGTLVGNSSGVIARVYSTADVSGTLFVGGLVGFHSGSGSLIADAWAGGNVTGTGAVGGLVGTTYPGSAVDNVWASGNVTGTSSSIGGLVGAADVGSTLRNAYATGNVAGSLEVGGLVGYNRGLVEHVFATGGVSASSNSYVGGLVGHTPAGAGGSVSDGWFAGDTPGAHPDNGAGTAIPLANLISALPGGFDAAVWASQNGKTTPYLKSVPGAVYVKAESASPGSARVYTPVTTLEQLQAVGSDLAGHFALFDHIDATATRDWNGGAGFVPIGHCAGGFTGRFDGLGHVVGNLTIDRGDTLCVGLFGAIDAGSVVRNIGVDGGSVTGISMVGGLVGYSAAGTIDHAFATAEVAADTQYGGGLVGFTTGEVSHAYATGRVTVAGDGAGGLAGGNRGAISRTWASGQVTGNGTYVGGLVGLAMDGTVSDAYWDRFSTGQDSAVGFVNANATVTNLNPVTSDPAQSGAADYAFRQGAYDTASGQALGTFGNTPGSATWTMVDGATRPFLQMEHATRIGTAHQLQLMYMAPDAHYTLARHVDAGETGRSDGTPAGGNGMWPGTGFVPVGSDATPFSGGFDGRYHVIGDLRIAARSAADFGVAGLIGELKDGTIRRVGLLRPRVDLTGSGSYAMAGALVGYVKDAGEVEDSFALDADVSAVNSNPYANVGGLVGYNQGTIRNVYATGIVRATAADLAVAGGLLGLHQGVSLDRAYAAATASASSATYAPHVGGLVGRSLGGVTTDSFWDTDASGQDASAGGTGLSTLRWLSQGPIATGLWDTAATWAAGYPYPVLNGFPHVRVVAQGAHVMQGVPAVSVDAYTVVDHDGIDASALVDGTPSWFADPALAAGATANVGGTGVTVRDSFHQRTYIGSGVVTSTTYTIGGTVAGLASGQTVQVQINGGDTQVVSADAPVFTFAPLANGTAWTVTVSQQPASPLQRCAVTSHASGTLAGADVGDVGVTCTTAALTLTLTQAAPGYVTYGRIVDYIVTLSNSGNGPAVNAAVNARFGGGADVGAATWQCIAGSVNAHCTPSGGGPIDDSVTVPPGVSMTWLIHVPVAIHTAAGTLDFRFEAEGLDPVTNAATIVLFRDDFEGAP